MECRDACSHAVLTVRRNVLPESTVRCAPPVIMTSSSSPPPRCSATGGSAPAHCSPGQPSYSWSPTAPELRGPHDAVPFLMRNPGLSPGCSSAGERRRCSGCVGRAAVSLEGRYWLAEFRDQPQTASSPMGWMFQIRGPRFCRHGGNLRKRGVRPWRSRIGRAGDRREQGYRTGVHPRSARPGRSQGVCGRPRPRERPGAGVETLRLDVTDEDQIAAAAVAASDATIVINNAGIQAGPSLLEDLWRARDASWR